VSAINFYNQGLHQKARDQILKLNSAIDRSRFSEVSTMVGYSFFIGNGKRQQPMRGMSILVRQSINHLSAAEILLDILASDVGAVDFGNLVANPVCFNFVARCGRQGHPL
jgi:hypothetical protein